MAKIIKEEMNLFSNAHGWWFAHCVSADFEMGAGIAKQFRTKYQGAQEYLRREFPMDKYHLIGSAIAHSNVIYLVTKKNYYDKPTYESMQSALNNLLRATKELCVKKLAIPMIGCGLDRLNWDTVEKMIETTFENENDLVIKVCIR